MWRIPLCDLNYGEEEQRAVADVLASKWLTMGPKTEEFEARLRDLLGVRHVIAVANGTCALQLAYKAMAVRASTDPSNIRIAVPDITFVATANAALAERFIPVLCDIANPRTPTLDFNEVSKLVDSGTLAGVTVVHYAGFDCGVHPVRRLCREHGVFLVEDAAHAIGGIAEDGAFLGTIGDIGCFSFFSNKNLATGEGGAVATNDDQIASLMRLWRSHGLSSGSTERHFARSVGYDVLDAGYNFRCSEIVAALGIEQLKKLPHANARRRELFSLYAERLRTVPGVEIAWGDIPDAIARSACHILPLLCATQELRDRVRDALHAAGIQTSHHYAPIHSFSFYRRAIESGTVQAIACTNAVEFAGRELTVPLYPSMPEVAVEEIAAIVERVALGERRE